MARRTRLERIAEIAAELAITVEAVNRLRKGANGSAITSVAAVLEKEARNAAAVLIRKKRRSKTGTFR